MTRTSVYPLGVWEAVVVMAPLDLLDVALGQADRPNGLDPLDLDRLRRLERALDLALDDGPGPEPPAGLSRRALDFVSRNADRPAVIEFAPPKRSAFTWRDFAVAASVFVGSLVALVPAIHQSRERARTEWCANNLRTVGLANFQRQDVRNEPVDSPANVFSALVDEGYLDRPDVFDCPCGGGQGHWSHVKGSPFLDSAPEFPKSCDYALHLGHKPAPGAVSPDKVRSSHMVPLIADRPASDERGRPLLKGNSPNHGGAGQNLFLSDGSVRFAPKRAVLLDDDIYLNRHRLPDVGVDPDDSVIVPGHFRKGEY